MPLKTSRPLSDRERRNARRKAKLVREQTRPAPPEAKSAPEYPVNPPEPDPVADKPVEDSLDIEVERFG